MINKDLKNTKFHFHLYNFRGDVTVRSQLANISTHPSIWRTSSWSTGGTTSLSRMPSPSRCSSNSFLVKYRLWWVLFSITLRDFYSLPSHQFLKTVIERFFVWYSISTKRIRSQDVSINQIVVDFVLRFRGGLYTFRCRLYSLVPVSRYVPRFTEPGIKSKK